MVATSTECRYCSLDDMTDALIRVRPTAHVFIVFFLFVYLFCVLRIRPGMQLLERGSSNSPQALELRHSCGVMNSLARATAAAVVTMPSSPDARDRQPGLDLSVTRLQL